MKIVQVVPRFPPAIGGMENHVYNISVELVKRGHEVTVVTSTDVNGEKSEVSKNFMDGLEVYRYPLFLPRFFREFWFMPSMLRTVKNLRGDVIHTHGYRCLSSCTAAYLSKLKGIPLVLTPHGIFPRRNWFNALMKFFYDHSLGNLLLKSSDKIIALTENNKLLLLKMGIPKDKIVVIQNGVDVNKFKRLQLLKDAKENYGFYGPVLLYVGRIAWHKRLEKVIEALPLITREFCDLKFLIVGPDYAKHSGDLLCLAKKLGVNDSVVITGSVSEKQVRLYYSMADIFMLPSIYEGLSLSMLEAMASRVPIIALSSGGTGGVLTHRVNAILSKNKTSEEISDSVSLLLNNPKLRGRICQNAFDLILQKYTWKSVVDKLERLYMEICGKH